MLRPNPPKLALLGTFGGLLPSLAGLSSQALGAWSFVAAAVVLLAGMVLEGI